MVEQLPGTPWSESLWWVLLVLVVIVSLVVVAGALRRFVLVRSGGAIECYLRVCGGKGRRGSWRVGFGRYGSRNLGWFPVLSLRPRPTVRLSRRGLVVVGRRSPRDGDAPLPADVTVLEIGWIGSDGADPTESVYEVAMGEGQLTGFLSWIESMPPGTRWEA
ncbi:DUF2550 domain-containing protein [Nocardiopsis sp. MG754419]|uniref:DUF2550 domain-containing protein n=1 Tax=Nocardiopsis sp. MG754419 TaxID=2259865 RepID=UPI001BA476CA|nr:DUF2550 domain-containing protein [Nocardiopsis sp. MG754419]MBR8740429.1 DUF2550 domain-containing protein [Nocardiopsis sp. MG754419]